MYTPPSVLIYQEFQTVPAAVTRPLRACLIGPNFQLVQYGNAATKQLGYLGAYDPENDHSYAWPSRAAGAIVDLDYTRLFIDNALLRYLDSTDLTAPAIKATYRSAIIGGYKNRVRAGNVNWKTFGAYDRNAALYDRDVKVGDVVTVSGVVDAAVVTLDTYVAGFVNDIDAAALGSPSADADNQGDVSKAVTVTQTAGTEDGLSAIGDANSYFGLVQGDVVETYTVTVTTGGDPADPLNLPLLRIRSASGHDDADDVVPEELGVPTAIGARGLTVTFHQASSSSLSASVPFVAGQVWRVNVQQLFDAPALTASGSYVGSKDTTYIVEVVTGGLYASGPTVKVSTTTGIDSAAPVVVASNGHFTLGTLGLSGILDGTGLNAGDRYYLPVTAASAGAVKTLVLGHNLPAGLLGASAGTEPALTVKLAIKKNIEVSRNRTGFAPLLNFETLTTEITTKAGIVAYDASWTDSGTPLALNVVGGSLFANYRAYLQAYTTGVFSITDLSEAPSIGIVDPDNPLAYGAEAAIAAANGTSIRFIAVCDNSSASWVKALGYLTGRQDIYGLTPLTFDRSLQNLVTAHAAAMSGATGARWRKVYLCSAAQEQTTLLGELAGEPVLATVDVDPTSSLSPAPVTVVELALGSGQVADLSTLGVRAGDIVRMKYEDDGFGGETYAEYQVDVVLSADSVRLVSGPDAVISTAAKIEIWRNLTAGEIAAQIAATSGSFSTIRVINVWPDYAPRGGVTVPGYFLAASVAGQVSGIVPHQGLSNVDLPGWDGMPRTTEKFTEDQLNTMAAGGTWIVTQDPISGAVFTRDALSTDMSDVKHAQEMYSRNVDSISYLILETLQPYKGRTNTAPENLEQMAVDVKAALVYISSATWTRSLGSQILDAKLLKLEQSPVDPSRVVVVLSLTLPFGIGTIEVHLQV